MSSARAHPAAAVQRRRERDFRFVLPLIQDLGERQYRLLLAFQAAILDHTSAALPAPIDDDVRDAAGTLASTLETARKGIIYEHQTASLPAQRLVAALRALMVQLERDGARDVEGAAVTVLRRIERGAHEAAAAFPEDGARAYLALLGRMMADAAVASPDSAQGADPDRPSGLIIPG